MSTALKLPIGESDFRRVIEKYYFVDKSLLIQEILEDSSSALLTRQHHLKDRNIRKNFSGYFRVRHQTRLPLTDDRNEA
jgi:hypothetical protein